MSATSLETWSAASSSSEVNGLIRDDSVRSNFLLLGENVVLLGEIVRKFSYHLNSICLFFRLQDSDKEQQLNLTQVSVEQILDAQRREIEAKQEKSALMRSRLKQRGVYNNNPLLEDNEWRAIFSLREYFYFKAFSIWFVSQNKKERWADHGSSPH